ncbi:membrane protein insertion efficiency factor YidD [bacterium]|nr:MAG: membrane protein insertion efficiency factor YidD [bacterium]
MLNFYHKRISPIYHSLGKSIFGSTFACRFTPTCSVYTRQAYRRYGIIVGTKLSFNRILRCNPFGKGGLDPVK